MGLNHNWSSSRFASEKTALILLISISVPFAYATEGTIPVEVNRVIDDIILDADCDDGDISNDFTNGVVPNLAVFGLLLTLDCKQGALQFNATTFGSNVWITDVDLVIDVVSVEDENCDVVEHEEDILSLPLDDLLNNINTNPAYVENNDFCTNIGTTTLDLGQDAIDDFNAAILDDQLFSVGLRWTELPTPAPLEVAQVTIDLDDTFLEIEYIATTFEVSQTVETIGDHFKITTQADITRFPGVFHNITSVRYYENGTAIIANGTDVNQTGLYQHVYEPRWPRILVDGPREIKSEITLQDRLGNIIFNETTSVLAREYEALYNPSVSDGLGKYNYTIKRIEGGDTVWFKINRINAPSGEVWPLNCNLLTTQEAIDFANTPEVGIWSNETNIGYRNFTSSGWLDERLYGTCYNPHDIVFHFQLFTNGSLALFGAEGADDLFGGFIGIPVGILFVAFIAYLATPKTAPTYIIFVMMTLAIVGAAGIVAITDNMWALLIVGAAVGLLVKKLL